MRGINRRRLLASLGVLGGTAALGGYRRSAIGQPDAPVAHATGDHELSASTGAVWQCVELDPEGVARRAYRIYPAGGCMYAVVGSVLGALADRAGEPFRSFPIEMMRFGDGGVGGWGSVCGVVNGGSALIGLFHNEEAKQKREELIAEFCTWYETTNLPTFEPANPQWADEAEPSVADSVLCHISTTRWCQASGHEAFSMAKKERCRRLAADGAMRIVEVLNRQLDADASVPVGRARDAQSCIDCHGADDMADTMGKMSCRSCHDVDADHP